MSRLRWPQPIAGGALHSFFSLCSFTLLILPILLVLFEGKREGGGVCGGGVCGGDVCGGDVCEGDVCSLLQEELCCVFHTARLVALVS
jgi:hypothetical protein